MISDTLLNLYPHYKQPVELVSVLYSSDFLFSCYQHGIAHPQSRQSTKLSLQSSDSGHPRRRVPPLWFRREAHSLAGEGVGVPIPTRGQTVWYSRYICTLWAHRISSLESDLSACCLYFAMECWTSFSKENPIGQVFVLLIVYCWLVYANYEMEFHWNTFHPCNFHPSSSFHQLINTHRGRLWYFNDFLWRLCLGLPKRGAILFVILWTDSLPVSCFTVFKYSARLTQFGLVFCTEATILACSDPENVWYVPLG